MLVLTAEAALEMNMSHAADRSAGKNDDRGIADLVVRVCRWRDGHRSLDTSSPYIGRSVAGYMLWGVGGQKCELRHKAQRNAVNFISADSAKTG